MQPDGIHFNSLPLGLRRRLAASAEGGTEAPLLGTSWGDKGETLKANGLTVGLLIGLAFLFSDGYGKRVQPLSLVLGYGLLSAALVYVGVTLWRKQRASGALPLERGALAYPACVISTGESIRVFPLSEALEARPEPEALVLRFLDLTVSFPTSDAAGKLAELQAPPGPRSLSAALLALASSAPEAGAAFVEADEEPRVAKGPPPLRDDTKLHGGLLLALLLGCAAGFVRNQRSDALFLERIRAQDSSKAYAAYLEGGGRQRNLVLFELKPAAALKEAKAAGTLAALRTFREEYADSELMKASAEAVAEFYARTSEGLRSGASGAAPGAVECLQALLAWLERDGSSELEVRFLPPNLSSLPAAEQTLAAALKRAKHSTGEVLDSLRRPSKVAPIGPAFDPKFTTQREAAITKSLQEGFAQVLPQDMVSLKQGSATGPSERPTLTVEYEVRGSEQHFTQRSDLIGPTAYMGIRIVFKATLRVPRAKPFTTEVVVEPPESFSLKRAEGALSYAYKVPKAVLVYDTMILRAFDRLAAGLQQSLFGR